MNNLDPKVLLPCPFCGGPAISGMTLDNLGYAMCLSDTCWGMTGYLETEEAAIAAWNRRPISAETAEAEVKRLTEEKEALRVAVSDALHFITNIDNAHPVVRKIRQALSGSKE